MDKLIEGIKNVLKDNYEDKILVFFKDGAISGGIYNIIGDHVSYDGDEFFDCIENIDISCFDKLGVYVYKFKNKELVEHKYISANKSNVFHGSDIGFVVIHYLYNLEPLDKHSQEILKENLKIDNIFNQENDNLDNTTLVYNGIKVEISSNYLESQKHIYEDFKAIENVDMKQLMIDKFIPWLKGDEFIDKDDEEIYNGLIITGIKYLYHHIVEKYSPTGKDDFFGEFEFSLESCSDYTKEMLCSVGMNIVVKDGNIVKVTGYDI